MTLSNESAIVFGVAGLALVFWLLATYDGPPRKKKRAPYHRAECPHRVCPSPEWCAVNNLCDQPTVERRAA